VFLRPTMIVRVSRESFACIQPAFEAEMLCGKRRSAAVAFVQNRQAASRIAGLSSTVGPFQRVHQCAEVGH